jgi:cell division protein FtsB
MWQKFKNSLLFRLLKNKFLIAGFLFLIWITFFDANNLIDWVKVRKNVKEQNRQIKYYQNEIENIDKKLNELNSNLDSLEKFAREQFYFKNPDEDIFVVTPSIPKSR